MKNIFDPIDALKILRSGQSGGLVEFYIKTNLEEFDANELIDLITRDKLLVVIEKREDDE